MSQLTCKLWFLGLAICILSLVQFRLLPPPEIMAGSVVLAKETKRREPSSKVAVSIPKNNKTSGTVTGILPSSTASVTNEHDSSIQPNGTNRTPTFSARPFRRSHKNISLDFLTVPLPPGVMNASTWRKKYERRPYPYGGAFVHIGKTGGSTLSKLLRHGCHSFMEHPCVGFYQEEESIASKYIETYYHIPDLPYLTYSSHLFYLVSIRDPLERTISAFVYQHPFNRKVVEEGVDGIFKKQRQAFTCFLTLEGFVRALGEPPFTYHYPYDKKEVVTENCTDFARAALDGKVQMLDHFFHNYDFVRSMLRRQAVRRQEKKGQGNATLATGVVLVVRQEFLQDDWVSVNQLLSGSAQKVHGYSTNLSAVTQRNVTGMALPVTRKLSKKGRNLLCLALQKEYQAYVWLLKQAINLNDQDRKESILQSYKKCPELAFLQQEIENIEEEN